MPNRAAPPSRRPSTSFLVGRSKSSARTGCGRLKMKRNAGIATNSAPPKTTARVGSHSPAKSRKPMILAGLTIPEMASPNPKSVPANKLTSIFSIRVSSEYVLGKEHGNGRRGKEHQRGDDRAPRQTCDANDAVAAGTARTQAGAEAHQKPRYHHDRQGCLYIDGQRGAGRQHVDESAEQKTHDEHRSPLNCLAFAGKQTVDDPADPSDFAVEQYQQHSRQPDEQPADEPANRSKVLHRRLLSSVSNTHYVLTQNDA